MPFYDLDDNRWPAFLSSGAALWALAAVIADRAGLGGRWFGTQLWTAGGRAWPTAGLQLAGAVALASLMSEPLSGWLGELWLGRRLRAALGPLLKRRRRRWAAAHAAGKSGGSPQHRLHHIALRNRIALAPPQSATWMGDRVQALETRVFSEYGLDFPSAWPGLWLVVPEPCRAELRSAATAWRRATRRGAWALLYGVLTVAWWPLLLVAGMALVSALRSARRAMEALTDLAEAAVDLHARDLAGQLGIDTADGQVDPPTGRLVTIRLRKGV
ncbi:hypothetical protein QFZ75_008083 [Streptomyces sp. V3I8]|uniref:hypothetical protein n=1 Tax=Streptomyces sp. V3I8 TaxID=3042279 RepID=UPI00277FC1E9|nr:hypothetical protein [Streptomyces sp. V3I8]MDQ1041581.1 hypothetical protein [Streptomyces sp. V3I8]